MLALAIASIITAFMSAQTPDGGLPRRPALGVALGLNERGVVVTAVTPGSVRASRMPHRAGRLPELAHRIPMNPITLRISLYRSSFIALAVSASSRTCARLSGTGRALAPLGF